jgi:hypothetical protein
LLDCGGGFEVVLESKVEVVLVFEIEGNHIETSPYAVCGCSELSALIMLAIIRVESKRLTRNRYPGSCISSMIVESRTVTAIEAASSSKAKAR